MFQRVLTEELISLVQLHEEIYNPQHTEYKNTRLKDKAWEKIGKSMGTDAETVKKKWKNVRDSYSKFLKAEKSRKEIDPGNLSRGKRWAWAQHMEFCRPYIYVADQDSSPTQDTETAVGFQDESMLSSTDNTFAFSNIEDHDNLLQNVESMMSAPEIKHIDLMLPSEENQSEMLTESTTPLNKRSYEEAFQRPAASSSSVDKILSYLEKRHPAPLLNFDSIELLFLGYAKTVKKFSPRRQAMVKFQISQMMMQEELNQLAEDDKCVADTVASRRTTTTASTNSTNAVVSNNEENILETHPEESMIISNTEETILS